MPWDFQFVPFIYFYLQCSKSNYTIKLNCVDRSVDSSAAAFAHLVCSLNHNTQTVILVQQTKALNHSKSCNIYTHTKAREPHQPTRPAILNTSPYTRPPAHRIISFKCIDGMEERSSTVLTACWRHSWEQQPLALTFRRVTVTDLLTAVKWSCWPDLYLCVFW